MTNFRDTDAAETFIQSGDSRETSASVMKAIAFYARNEAEAEQIWDGDLGGKCTFLDIWEHATGNGAHDADLEWGVSGSDWAAEFA